MCVYRRSIYLGFDLDLVARNKNLDPDTLPSGFGESDDGYLSMRVTFRTFALACVQTWSLMAKDHASHAERTSTPEDLTLRQLQVLCSAAPLRPICSPRRPCMTR